MIIDFLDSLLRTLHQIRDAQQQELEVLKQILRKEEQMADALTDLQGAVARLNSSSVAELQAISTKLGSLGGSVTAADVEAAVTSINAVADKLDAETAALVPPTPPPPPPPPAA